MVARRRRCCGCGPTTVALALVALLLDLAPLPPSFSRSLSARRLAAGADDLSAGAGAGAGASAITASAPSHEAVGAFFQVYRNAKATSFALRNFRAHYPRSTVVMVCDGAGPEADAAMSAIAAEHGALYRLEGHTPSGRRQSFVDMPGSALEWLGRIVNASCEVLARGGEPFMLLLEDDVWVMNRTRPETLHFDINGIEPQFAVFNSATNDYMRSKQPLLEGRPLVLAGFGGCIFRTAFLCAMRDEWPHVEADVGSFYGLVGFNVAAPDVIISFLTYLRGGTTGDYAGRTETWHGNYGERMRRFEQGVPHDIEVVHDYKVFYR